MGIYLAWKQIRLRIVGRPSSVDYSCLNKSSLSNRMNYVSVTYINHLIHKLRLCQLQEGVAAQLAYCTCSRWTQNASPDWHLFVCVHLGDGQWCRSLPISWQHDRCIFHGQVDQLAKQAIISRRRDSAVRMQRKLAASGRCRIFSDLSKRRNLDCPPALLW